MDVSCSQRTQIRIALLDLRESPVYTLVYSAQRSPYRYRFVDHSTLIQFLLQPPDATSRLRTTGRGTTVLLNLDESTTYIHSTLQYTPCPEQQWKALGASERRVGQ
jgi:hypothetical protein